MVSQVCEKSIDASLLGVYWARLPDQELSGVCKQYAKALSVALVCHISSS